MADIARHVGYGVKYNNAMIAGIVEDSVKLNPNIEKLIARYSGAIRPTLGALLKNEPVATFQTRDIDLISAAAAISANPVILYFQAYDEATGLGTGYISYTIAKGIIVPKKLSGNEAQDAKLELEVHAISSDGDTSPIAVGTASATTTAHGDAYTIGGVSLGSSLASVKSIDFDFGYTIDKNAGDSGKPFPTLAYVSKQEAKLTVQSAALAEATTDRLNTGQSVTSSLSFIFRKLAEGGIPSGTLTGTITKLLVQASVSDGHPATVDLQGTLIESSANYISWAAA